MNLLLTEPRAVPDPSSHPVLQHLLTRFRQSDLRTGPNQATSPGNEEIWSHRPARSGHCHQIRVRTQDPIPSVLKVVSAPVATMRDAGLS